MVQRKAQALPQKRLVWRISQAAPLGEFVDPNAPLPALEREDLPETSTGGGWAMSSFELLHGADVSEGPDTVPDEVFDELFRPTRADHERSPR